MEPLLDVLANYHKEWDEQTILFRDAPAHDWSSHFADAFRYLAVGYDDRADDSDGADTYPFVITAFNLRDHRNTAPDIAEMEFRLSDKKR